MKSILLAGIGLAITAIEPAAAADLPVKAPIAPPVVAYDWNGFYIGGNVGYSWGRAKTLDGTFSQQVYRAFGLPAQTLVSDTGPVAFPGIRTDVNGWLGGGQIGWNWQQNAWLLGIEADIQASGQDGDHLLTFTIPATGAIPAQTATLAANYKLDWFGTVRGRLGVLPGDRYLLYVTGGLVYGNLKSTYTGTLSGVGSVSTSFDETRAGWTVGGGIEAALWGTWTAKIEYLYMDLGRFSSGGGTLAATSILPNVPNQGFTTVTNVSANTSVKFTDNILRVGLNYRFSPGPVVARY
jgi:outer membrane immunogenic protein